MYTLVTPLALGYQDQETLTPSSSLSWSAPRCLLFQSRTLTLYHCTYDTVIDFFWCWLDLVTSLVNTYLGCTFTFYVSFFILLSAFSRSYFCAPTLYSHWMHPLVPLTYFCGHSLDINKIILSYLIKRSDSLSLVGYPCCVPHSMFLLG